VTFDVAISPQRTKSLGINPENFQIALEERAINLHPTPEQVLAVNALPTTKPLSQNCHTPALVLSPHSHKVAASQRQS
jgi:hypothetical protein